MRDDLRFRPGDAIAAIAVLALAGLLLLVWLWLPRDRQTTVQIYQNGVLIRELPLDTDTSFTIGGTYENTISIENGTVSVTRATCPGEDCVHTGKVSHAGQSILCLPNRLEVRLSGTPEIDEIAR